MRYRDSALSVNRGGITRRRFVQGLVAAGVVAGVNLRSWPALAHASLRQQEVLRGNHFELTLEEVAVNYTGRPRLATAVNGSVPGPRLHWREGDTVTIAVTNHLRAPTSIHWHGVRVPASMDGVPGLSFSGIAPGETFVYRFPVLQHGTYWYHSHSRFQEQTGHYGPLIIEPSGADPVQYDRDYVVLLSDWTDENPETIFANLKQQSDYYNFHQRTVGTFISDVRKSGFRPTLAERLRWGAMNMSPTDILDVSGAAYTYLMNGATPAANWTALFNAGERVRLRFINGSSMSIFDVRIPGLPMTVVQADGNDVDPVTIDEFRISVAETYDVIVAPQAARAYTIFVQSEDRTGYARGTLAPALGMAAPIPPMDPRPQLTMVDMGMGAMNSTPGMTGDMAGMDMDESPGSEPGSMRTPAAAPNRSQTGAGRDFGATPFPQPNPNTPLEGPLAMATPSRPPEPIALQVGPEVDNVAQSPSERLGDPGIGLSDNGRRVLTYADLRARYRGADPRPPEREIELHLTGNMQRFIWGFDGHKFSEAEPLRLRLGERVRIILVNDTMMAHPIHLHGLWSELENGHGDRRPYKHTINVKPGERLSYRVSADTPGRWAYHCHLLYHMESGMFREVVVA
jgi:CopA family copper-resistance protein